MRLVTILVGVVATIVVLFALLWVMQRRLIYFPAGDPGPAPAGWSAVVVTTESGLELEAWHRPADSDDAPIVIVLPGNAGNRSGRVPLGNALGRQGLEVLLVDYRGYGGNPGAPTETGLAEDARAAARLATTLAPGRPVVYFGESLGAGVVGGLAVEERPAAMILASPYTSLTDLARHHYPWAPSFLLKDRYPLLDRFESGALAGVPVFVVAGTADRVVPVAQSRTIAGVAGAELYEVEGAGHNDPAIRSAPALVSRLAGFIRESIG